MTVFDLEARPIHLGLGATAEAQPVFTGDMAWYASYAERIADDGAEGRLVALHEFSEPWTSWEMHPYGSEVVLCLSGEMTLLQDRGDRGDGGVDKIPLKAGEYAINAPGVWHTADVAAPARVLFITAGLGTEHRPR